MIKQSYLCLCWMSLALGTLISVEPSDFFRATVFHEKPLSAEESKALELLKQEIKNVQAPLNLLVEVLDLSEKPMQRAYVPRGEKLPAIALYAPASAKRSSGAFEPPVSFWSGSLDIESVKLILNSPVRQQVARQLLAGNTAVWLVLSSGDSTKDKQALGSLTSKIKMFQSGLMNKDDSVPFLRKNANSSFSIIPLSSEDKRESVLLSMLLSLASDASYQRGEAMVFPFFGKGWVYPGQQGELSDGVFSEVCASSGGGGCASGCCAGKSKKKVGYKMMLAANWDATRLFNPVSASIEKPAELVEVGVGDRAVEPVSIEKSSNPLTKNLIVLIFGLSGAVFLVSGVLFLKRRQSD